MLVVYERGRRSISLLDNVTSVENLNMVCKEAVSSNHRVNAFKKSSKFPILRVCVLKEHIQILFEKEFGDWNYELLHILLLHCDNFKLTVCVFLEKHSFVVAFQMLA